MPLIISPETQQRISAAKQKAVSQSLDLVQAAAIGKLPKNITSVWGDSLTFEGFRVTFSHDIFPNMLMQHLSISREDRMITDDEVDVIATAYELGPRSTWAIHFATKIGRFPNIHVFKRLTH